MRAPIFTAMVLTMANALCAPPAHAQQEPKPEMWEETNHQLVLNKDQTRVVDVRIAPGLTTGFHYHQYATVYVIVQDSHLMGQVYGSEWSEPATVPYRDPGAFAVRTDYLTEHVYHRARNIDGRTTHFFAVVNMRKKSDEPANPDSNPSDRVVDNQWFRGHRIELGPGETSDILSYPQNAVLMQYDDLPSHVVENGVAHSFKGAPGAFSWHLADSKFQIRNGSEQSREFILIEVKD